MHTAEWHSCALSWRSEWDKTDFFLTLSIPSSPHTVRVTGEEKPEATCTPRSVNRAHFRGNRACSLFGLDWDKSDLFLPLSIPPSPRTVRVTGKEKSVSTCTSRSGNHAHFRGNRTCRLFQSEWEKTNLFLTLSIPPSPHTVRVTGEEKSVATCTPRSVNRAHIRGNRDFRLFQSDWDKTDFFSH